MKLSAWTQNAAQQWIRTDEAGRTVAMVEVPEEAPFNCAGVVWWVDVAIGPNRSQTTNYRSAPILGTHLVALAKGDADRQLFVLGAEVAERHNEPVWQWAATVAVRAAIETMNQVPLRELAYAAHGPCSRLANGDSDLDMLEEGAGAVRAALIDAVLGKQSTETPGSRPPLHGAVVVDRSEWVSGDTVALPDSSEPVEVIAHPTLGTAHVWRRMLVPLVTGDGRAVKFAR